MTRVRWATFLLGAWVAGSVAMSVVATQNFYTVDRLLASSPSQPFHTFAGQVATPHARELLRYLVSELNRLFFHLWNYAQLALGVATLLLLRGARAAVPARWGVLAMFAVVVLMAAYLEPQITSLGRQIDFVPRTPPPREVSRFGVLHAAYTSLEIAKMLAGIGLAALLTRVER